MAVFKFCLDNKIKLIYSATSASLGNNGNDKNFSPYAFTKSKNLELLENFKKWFKLNYEIIYFYNVYGPRQISVGPMATVIGIFNDHYKNKKPLPVVRPEVKLEDLHIFQILLMFVMKLGKKIDVLIILFQIKNHIQLRMLQKCIILK